VGTCARALLLRRRGRGRRWRLLASPAPVWLSLGLRSSEKLTLPEGLLVKPLQALGEPGVPGWEAECLQGLEVLDTEGFLV